MDFFNKVIASPAAFIFMCSLISGIAGIASILRSGKVITRMLVITSGLNSFLVGTAISLLWYNNFKDNLYVLMGLAVTLGLSGTSALDLLLSVFQKGGLSINIGSKPSDNKFDFDFKGPI